MSENIRGITFAEQTVTPADDAIVRRAMLSDGILSGCNITYSGSTLTMAAGYVIACGRAFQITAAQNWAVVDATSGVARLVLTIDLTKTATETAFDQISFSIEYATAENGFVNLTQDDINLAGTRYQVAVAVVSLGTGGITGILSKLEKAEGGGGLNFKVVPGLTQPGSATENTIWVKTEKIPSWVASAAEPEAPENDMVWLLTGTTGDIAFNALKKNTLQIYVSSVLQYKNGEWVDAEGGFYQNGAWIDFINWDGRLYDQGEEFSSITGGWVFVKGRTESYIGQGTGTKKATSIHLDCPQNDLAVAAVTADMIDLTDYTNIKCNVTSLKRGCRLMIAKSQSMGESGNAYSEATSTGEISLNVASFSGSYYVAVVTWALDDGKGTAYAEFDKVWME